MLYPLYQTQGAIGGGSIPHTVQLTPRSQVVSPPEGLSVAEMSQLDDITLSAIDFGQDSYAKNISSRTPKRHKKHMGFTELMNAPDVDEVQQREEEMDPTRPRQKEMVVTDPSVTLPPTTTSHPSEAPLQPPSGHPTDLQPHRIAEDRDEPPAESRTASKRLDFDDPPES
ncbi:hypothetical protein SUGI_1175520 [Cryptomeria japonica]|nr:hypothetical protein SUGI_1175520 [Cryptomeria japonica]